MSEMAFTAMPGCEVGPGWVRWENRQCADHGDNPCEGCPDPNLLELEFSCEAPEDEHLQALVAYIVDQAHEAIEWIRMDGKRFAEPHPVQEDAAWELLMAGVGELLSKYRNTYPTPENVEEPTVTDRTVRTAE